MEVSASLDLYSQVYHNNPAKCEAEMPELGPGVVQRFKTVLNMADFAVLSAGKFTYDPLTWKTLCFCRLALGPDGTRLVDISKEDYLDKHSINGELQQLAVTRSGIDKLVDEQIKRFLETLGGGKSEGPKLPSLNSSMTSPMPREETPET